MTTISQYINSIGIRTTNSQLTIFSIGLAFVFVYSLMPTIVNGWNHPPGNDIASLIGIADEIYQNPIHYTRYFGSVPIIFVSVNIYYYSVPILIYLALFFTLRKYSLYCPIIAWTLLFFLMPSILEDMEAGSFVGVIGFYVISLIIIYITSNIRDFRSVYFLLPIALLFHIVAGSLAIIAYIVSVLLTKRYIRLLPLLPVIGIATYWATQGSSLSQIGSVIPFIHTDTLEALWKSEPKQFTDVMSLMVFIKTRLGISSFAFASISLLMLYNALRRGYRPKFDPFILGLIFLCAVLSIFTFTEMQINSDRTAKFLSGIIIILSSVSIISALKYLNIKLLNYSAILFGVLLLSGTFIEQYTFWLELGILI